MMKLLTKILLIVLLIVFTVDTVDNKGFGDKVFEYFSMYNYKI